jgi:hypothetical protein
MACDILHCEAPATVKLTIKREAIDDELGVPAYPITEYCTRHAETLLSLPSSAYERVPEKPCELCDLTLYRVSDDGNGEVWLHVVDDSGWCPAPPLHGVAA